MNEIKTAVVMPHPGCNMFCSFCVTEDSFDCMTFDQGMDLLHRLKDFGIENVVFGGGEPFCWPFDILKLCMAAKEMGFFVQAGTNGTLLPEGFEKLSCIDRFVIPLESADPAVHNRMRFYGDSHFSVIMNVLERLKSAGKQVTVSTVLTSVNRDSADGLAEFLREYNSGTEHVHAWHLYQFIPQGRGGRANASELYIPQEDYHEICSRLKAMNLPFSVFKRPDMYNSRTVEFFRYENGRMVIPERLRP